MRHDEMNLRRDCGGRARKTLSSSGSRMLTERMDLGGMQGAGEG